MVLLHLVDLYLTKFHQRAQLHFCSDKKCNSSFFISAKEKETFCRCGEHFLSLLESGLFHSTEVAHFFVEIYSSKVSSHDPVFVLIIYLALFQLI